MLIEMIKKITTEVKEMKEINLPYFCKGTGSFSNYLLAVIDPKRIICVSESGVNTWSHITVEEAVSGDPITEAEFVAAYTIARAKTSFNLQPIPGTNGTGY